jgi:hypothetical protein
MRLTTIAALILSGLTFVGCEKKEDAASSTPGGSTAGEKLPGRDTVSDVTEKAKDAAAGATEKAKEVGNAAVEQATKMVDQVKQYIKDNKLTDAEAVLGKLEGMKASLPQPVHNMIAECKTMLDKAKAALPK